jgi:acyl dehydratase
LIFPGNEHRVRRDVKTQGFNFDYTLMEFVLRADQRNFAAGEADFNFFHL